VNKKSLIWHLVLLVTGVTALSAQFPNEVSTCLSGVQPDGFVDWTKLPTAPTAGTVSTTIPVVGIPNLTATFQGTPAIQTFGEPFYAAGSNTDLSLINGFNPTITFSLPVRGVSAVFRTSGRFGHTFKMLANPGPANVPPGFPAPLAEVDSSQSDLPTFIESSAPLQIRTTSAKISAVSFQFDADPGEYGGYELINLRVESGAAPDPATKVPTDGLREWLRGDRPGTVRSYFLSPPLVTWPDQSGSGSDAIAPSLSVAPPEFENGPNCTPVVSFGGGSQLNFDLPINGWTQMTVFMAGAAAADAGGWFENQALFWNETAPWGTTFFSPSQSNAFFRFGTTQVNNQPIYARPMNIGGDFNVTTAIHNVNTDSLYVNGALVLKEGGKRAAISGTVPTATIGAGLNNTFFTGDIGEILIYDRALSESERQTVERYLMAKYGIPY
jgi:hypothetical protein